MKSPTLVLILGLLLAGCTEETITAPEPEWFDFTITSITDYYNGDSTWTRLSESYVVPNKEAFCLKVAELLARVEDLEEYVLEQDLLWDLDVSYRDEYGRLVELDLVDLHYIEYDPEYDGPDPWPMVKTDQLHFLPCGD